MMDLDWLKKLAPTVASALGGPLAGMAVTALGDALGWSDATQDKVSTMLQGPLTPEQLTAIRVAEMDLKKHESEMGFKFAELENADRKSARDMQVATKSVMPALLTCVIVGAALALEGYVLIYGLPGGANDFVSGRILGTLDSLSAVAVAFWLGSTKNSQVKDETIRAQAVGK